LQLNWGTPGTADYNAGNILLTLCSSEIIERGTIYQFGMPLINPANVQSAPDLKIKATGEQEFPQRPVIPPSSAVYPQAKDKLAEGGLRDALRIEPQGFLLRELSQINTVTNEANTITVSLISSNDIIGSNVQTIDIANLTGATFGNDPTTIVELRSPPTGSEADRLFCVNDDDNMNRRATWTRSSSTLSLKLCSNTTMVAERVYALKIDFINGPYPQTSPAITIELKGTDH